MKKDILAIVSAVLIIAVLIGGVEIQSVDEYYLTHIDDIKPDSATVFLSVRCDTVFSNYDKLDESLKSGSYLPSDGIILDNTEYVLREGDTVYDILSRVLRYKKIQMEYRGGNKNSIGVLYIAGINYLYEYSCGPLSGWMFKVNGEFPSCGCAEYTLSDGDVIEFVYSCDLGHDIGNSSEGGIGNE